MAGNLHLHTANEMGLEMFKITYNTARHFSLAEILVMAAINQIEAKRKAGRND
ncbi:MAG TPA: hypothetical protein VMU05_24635 [Dongiaceae bacterium]|nr:hypothetical protein [Dongiaceae bacterium]